MLLFRKIYKQNKDKTKTKPRQNKDKTKAFVLWLNGWMDILNPFWLSTSTYYIYRSQGLRTKVKRKEAVENICGIQKRSGAMVLWDDE